MKSLRSKIKNVSEKITKMNSLGIYTGEEEALLSIYKLQLAKM